MYVEENIFLKIIYFKFSKKGYLPNLLFLVSSRSKDVSSGSSESPGSNSETVSMVTLWRLPRRLNLAFFFALSAGKTTSHVLILTNYQLAIWYHQCEEMFFFYSYQMPSVDTQTHGRTQAHTQTDTQSNVHTDIFILRGYHSQSKQSLSAESLPVLKKHLKTSTENTSVSDDWYCGSRVEFRTHLSRTSTGL